MEIDTGSAVTLLSINDFKELGETTSTLKPPTIVLKGYTGDVIKCFGEKKMAVQVGEQKHNLIVRAVDGRSLLGRDMMSMFTLPWHSIFSVASHTSNDIINQYPELFDNSSLGKLKNVQVSLKVKNDNPVFLKPRVKPFAIRDKYEKALAKLEAEKVVEKVDHSDWASPTVQVIKPVGNLRICGDYSVTMNKFAIMKQYPCPLLKSF